MDPKPHLLDGNHLRLFILVIFRNEYYRSISYRFRIPRDGIRCCHLLFHLYLFYSQWRRFRQKGLRLAAHSPTLQHTLALVSAGRVGCSQALSTQRLLVHRAATGGAKLWLLVLSFNGHLHLSLIRQSLVSSINFILLLFVFNKQLLQVKPIQAHDRVLTTLLHYHRGLPHRNRQPDFRMGRLRTHL